MARKYTDDDKANAAAGAAITRGLLSSVVGQQALASFTPAQRQAVADLNRAHDEITRGEG